MSIFCGKSYNTNIMEDSMDIPQPDKLRLVGPVKDPQKIESAKAYLETNKIAMPPEQKRTPERATN